MIAALDEKFVQLEQRTCILASKKFEKDVAMDRATRTGPFNKGKQSKNQNKIKGHSAIQWLIVFL